MGMIIPAVLNASTSALFFFLRIQQARGSITGLPVKGVIFSTKVYTVAENQPVYCLRYSLGETPMILRKLRVKCGWS